MELKNLKLLSVFAILVLVSFSATGKDVYDFKWVDEVGAQTFPTGEEEFCVNDYGVKSRPDFIAITSAIQAAIDACYENGGGVVTFKPGTYLTGAIFLKDNVHLKIDKGVTLLAIQDVKYYPEMESRIAGIEMTWPSAVINVIGKKNVAITGEGVIDAQGRYLWERYWNERQDYEKKQLRWIVDYDVKRVRTLLISDSENVTLKGLSFQQSGFWTVHVLYSNQVTIDGVNIRNNIKGMGPSTDGIDIDSSTKILVENSDIDCHDDNFCLKAGRDADGIRVNRPTEYVVIRNCISRVGSGLITIGSETSGSVRNVLAYNLKAIGTSTGIKLKSALTRGGTVENIYIHDVELENVGTAISVGLNWNPSYSYSKLPDEFNYETIPHHWKVMLTQVEPEVGLPKFQHVKMENFRGENIGTAIFVEGIEKSTVDDFILNDMVLACKKAGGMTYAKDWEVKNVKITTQDNSEVTVKNSKGMKTEFTK